MDSSNNSFIDDLSLQYLTNKTVYNKCLSTIDESKYNEVKNFHNKINDHKERILEITKNYLNNPELQISSDLDNIFETFVKHCIRHIEMKKLESINDYNKNDDPDTLFEKMEECLDPIHSFWGAGVRKI